MTKQSMIRVRYAPSPTGHLHIGGARSALFNYLFANRNGGKFIVRIEDTDQKRNVADAAEKQMENLQWLGIQWDESIDIGGEYGPYRSMERLDIYRDYINRLLEKGHAFPCYCTEEELEHEREIQRNKGLTPKYSGKCRHLSAEERQRLAAEGRQPSIRFKVPDHKEYVIHDLVRGDVRFDSEGIGDFVIVKQDGIPTYNFAVVIDDHLMKISHVIRGEEHLSNTPRQLMIYEALEFSAPQFAHVSLILNQDRQKMSKRDESIIQFVDQYRELGYLPEAILNFLVLLGWAPEEEREIYSREELIERFSLERVSKSPAVFDTDKLRWMNNHYIKNSPVERIEELCLPHLRKAGYIPEVLDEEQVQWVRALVALHQEKLGFAAEIVDLTAMFFIDHMEYDGEASDVLSGEQVPAVLKAFRAHLERCEPFGPDEIKVVLKEVQKETGCKGKDLFMPVRAASTGQCHGPDLAQSLYLLGKEKILSRLDRLISK